MLAYKDSTCSTTECCRNAYVAMDLWSQRMDRVRNDDIRDRLGVAPIEEKLVQHLLRWFDHVQRRPQEAPVHCGVLSQANNMRGRGRPKLTWGGGNKKRFESLGYT